jgi:peroxiredoxin
MIRSSLLACSVLVAMSAQMHLVGAADAFKIADQATSTREWRDAEGQMHTPLANHGQRATVLVFVMPDCPVTNSSAPEFNRLADEFGKRGVRFFRIYSPETAAEIREHGREFGLTFPGLCDPTSELARLTGATRAPEAVVISPNGELLYRGRIDDRAVQPGRTRPVASRRDLHLAIEAILAGQVPEQRFTPVEGCYLPINDKNPPTIQAAATTQPNQNKP